MHEYALTTAIIEQLLEEIDFNNLETIVSVSLGFGPFSHSSTDSIEFWWEILTENTILEGSNLIFKDLAGKLFCPSCDQEFEIVNNKETHVEESLNIYACPLCSSLQTEIKSCTDITILSYECIEQESSS